LAVILPILDYAGYGEILTVQAVSRRQLSVVRAGEGGDYGEQHRQLRAHQPHEVAIDLGVQAGQSALDAEEPLVAQSESLIDLLESLIDLSESLIDLPESLIDLPESLIDLPESSIHLRKPLVHVGSQLGESGSHIGNGVLQVDKGARVFADGSFQVGHPFFNARHVSAPLPPGRHDPDSTSSDRTRLAMRIPAEIRGLGREEDAGTAKRVRVRGGSVCT
jgi:hypothetical protein